MSERLDLEGWEAACVLWEISAAESAQFRLSTTIAPCSKTANFESTTLSRGQDRSVIDLRSPSPQSPYGSRVQYGPSRLRPAEFQHIRRQLPVPSRSAESEAATDWRNYPDLCPIKVPAPRFSLQRPIHDVVDVSLMTALKFEQDEFQLIKRKMFWASRGHLPFTREVARMRLEKFGVKYDPRVDALWDAYNRVGWFDKEKFPALDPESCEHLTRLLDVYQRAGWFDEKKSPAMA
ncbi:hypothetical protein LTR17_019973 [Elasticomyces elasticus]|nr:hypothetical protein LTR17_019973 [Elasticomyces elasticus]